MRLYKRMILVSSRLAGSIGVLESTFLFLLRLLFNRASLPLIMCVTASSAGKEGSTVAVLVLPWSTDQSTHAIGVRCGGGPPPQLLGHLEGDTTGENDGFRNPVASLPFRRCFEDNPLEYESAPRKLAEDVLHCMMYNVQQPFLFLYKLCSCTTRCMYGALSGVRPLCAPTPFIH